jgi:hypothetical protein
MPLSFLLASSDNGGLQMLLQTAAKQAFDDIDRISLIALDAETALGAIAAMKPGPDETFLVVDARLPPKAGAMADPDGQGALALLQKLRQLGNKIPAMVITPRAMAMVEIDEYCKPENGAIALPQQWLADAPTLAGFVGMLRKPAVATWTAIEVEVKSNAARCHLRARDGTVIDWGSAALGNYLVVPLLAQQFANFPFQKGWSKTLHTSGAILFNSLVLPVIGPGLFTHLEKAAGGLRGLAFRFRVDDPALYAAPFEATVRMRGLDGGGSDDEFTHHPFVLLHAPITRRMGTNPVRTAAAGGIERISPHARLLFVRAQPGEHPDPASQTASDTLAVPESDRASGGIKERQVDFGRLVNIDRELEDLKALRDKNLIELHCLNLSKKRGSEPASKTLRNYLADKRFDIIHFAGHSLTTRDNATLLVLPGERPGEAEKMMAETFADLASGAGARLVYLSSCQGSSANTVASLAQRDVPCVLGFRWDVEDARAADFASAFYDGLFIAKQTICAAFRTACHGVYKPPPEIEVSPIWASPILASQSDDWITQYVL